MMAYTPAVGTEPSVAANGAMPTGTVAIAAAQAPPPVPTDFASDVVHNVSVVYNINYSPVSTPEAVMLHTDSLQPVTTAGVPRLLRPRRRRPSPPLYCPLWVDEIDFDVNLS